MIKNCCGCSAGSICSFKAKIEIVMVPDRAKHKALWPILGRPGAVLLGTEIVGSWRPKTAGKEFTLRLDLWTSLSRPTRRRLDLEAERLAAHRGLKLAAIVEQ